MLRCYRVGEVLHPSRGPSWPATSKTGVTIMQMEKGLDTGPVYASESLMIDDYDDVGALEVRILAETGARLLINVLKKQFQHPTPQPTDGVTYAHSLTATDRIDTECSGDCTTYLGSQPSYARDHHNRTNAGADPEGIGG